MKIRSPEAAVTALVVIARRRDTSRVGASAAFVPLRKRVRVRSGRASSAGLSGSDGLNVEVVLRIGGGDYPLEEAEALWLESTIRRRSFDASGRPWDREAAAALDVADVLDAAVSRRWSPEPVEVGRAAALGLLNVFQDGKDDDDVFAHVASSAGVAALYLSLRRFVLEAA